MSAPPVESLVPKLRPEVQVFRRADGTGVIFDPRGGGGAEVAADEASVLVLLDGKRSSPEIVAEHYRLHKFVPFQALGDLLSKLRSLGLLENPRAELDAAGVPPASWGSRLGNRVSGSLIRVPLPWGRSVAIAAFLFSLGAMGLGWSLAGVGATWPGIAAIRDADPLIPQGSPFAGLVGLFLGATLAITARSLFLSGLGALLGARPAHLELRLRFLLPSIEIGACPNLVLERGRRAAAFAFALLAHWALALLAVVWSGRYPEALAVALGALLAGTVDLCPFAPTAMGQLLAAVAGRVDLRDHARSYLSRKVLSRVSATSFFQGEKVMLIAATFSTLWCAAAINLVWGVPGELIRLSAAGLSSQGADSTAAWILVVLIGGGGLFAFVTILGTMASALGSTVPARLRRLPAKAAETRSLEGNQDAGALLRGVALFAALPEPALAELAKEVVWVTYPPGAVVVRQGDPGDRFFAIVQGRVAVLREQESGLEKSVAVLSPGDCFGEIALLAPVPRSATVRATEKVALLALGREGFGRLVKALPGVDLTRMIRAAATLHRNPLFGSLPPERVASLLPKLAPKHVAAGEVVVRRGEPGDFFYMIDDGELEVLDEGDVHPVAKLSNGDHFGEIALLGNVPRVATVRAVRASSLWELAKADFFGVLSRDMALSQRLEEEARARLREKR